MRTYLFAFLLVMLPALGSAQITLPEQELPVEAPERPAAAPATLLPDISVIGNFVGRAASRDIDERDRSYLALQEAEVAFQSRIYPNIRADFIVAMEDREDHAAALEEGYATITQIGQTNLSARLGRLRTPFGKLNPTHPHQWLFVNQPPVVTAFLGEHGLIGQGAAAQYLLPTGRFFANLELGRWSVVTHGDAHSDEDEEEHEEGAGIFDSTFNQARLWTSFAPTQISELEFGLSGLRGNAPVEHDERGRVNLLGADMTYRRWPSAFSRDLLRLEWISHRSRFEGERHARSGYYLLAARQPDQYWEYGVRLDRTAFPFPIEGRWSSAVAFLTRRLTESTYMRLQAERGRLPEVGGYSAAYVQMVFGMGPHSHPIE